MLDRAGERTLIGPRRGGQVQADLGRCPPLHLRVDSSRPLPVPVPTPRETLGALTSGAAWGS
ncbi:hypothetical protein C884_00108 [Kocuria palustris PEL]|uniref:Uncharacterized protein n=1 Tax=Kocuria palustris PEL TaxID=1236550 RepID=M2XYZ6_9MICC|nr:hypothetical protein C884_00108 [Kocuria palustris PEL]